MSNFCSYKEFLKELDYCKSDMNVWGIQYDIMQTVYSLKRAVKDFFPINGVPIEIMNSLRLLEERMQIAHEQLCITCEKIILEVEQQRQKAYPNE